MMTVISVLLMLTGVSYFAVYMQKRKNNKQKDIGYRIAFATIFLLLGVIAITGG